MKEIIVQPEGVYFEDGIKITKYPTVGRPLKIRLGWYVDIMEMPTENLGKSWRDINNESKNRNGVDGKPIATSKKETKKRRKKFKYLEEK